MGKPYGIREGAVCIHASRRHVALRRVSSALCCRA